MTDEYDGRHDGRGDAQSDQTYAGAPNDSQVGGAASRLAGEQDTGSFPIVEPRAPRSPVAPAASSAATRPSLGETHYSVQHRCPQIWKHGPSDHDLPTPCPECYSLIVTSTVIPYRENVRWQTEPIHA